jgi:hypothetical protein
MVPLSIDKLASDENYIQRAEKINEHHLLNSNHVTNPYDKIIHSPNKKQILLTF